MAAITSPARTEVHCITIEDRLRASIKRVPVADEAEESTESYEASAAVLADRKLS